jgi:hypothetical protein
MIPIMLIDWCRSKVSQSLLSIWGKIVIVVRVRLLEEYDHCWRTLICVAF